MQTVLDCGCPTAAYGWRSTDALQLRRSTGAPTCRLRSHTHDEARLVLTLSGEWQSRYGHRAILGGPGIVLYRPVLEEHSDRYGAESVCLSVSLPCDDAVW